MLPNFHTLPRAHVVYRTRSATTTGRLPHPTDLSDSDAYDNSNFPCSTDLHRTRTHTTTGTLPHSTVVYQTHTHTKTTTVLFRTLLWFTVLYAYDNSNIPYYSTVVYRTLRHSSVVYNTLLTFTVLVRIQQQVLFRTLLCVTVHIRTLVQQQSSSALFCGLPNSYAYDNSTLPYYSSVVYQTHTHTTTVLFHTTLLWFTKLIRIRQQYSSILLDCSLLYSSTLLDCGFPCSTDIYRTRTHTITGPLPWSSSVIYRTHTHTHTPAGTRLRTSRRCAHKPQERPLQRPSRRWAPQPSLNVPSILPEFALNVP
jgi:hypothetical protein